MRNLLAKLGLSENPEEMNQQLQAASMVNPAIGSLGSALSGELDSPEDLIGVGMRQAAPMVGDRFGMIKKLLGM